MSGSNAAKPPWSLQWSRPSAGTETVDELPSERRLHPAMEPSLSRDGDAEPGHRERQDRVPAMEPSLSRDGDVADPTAPFGYHFPAMEPSLSTDGDKRKANE